MNVYNFEDLISAISKYRKNIIVYEMHTQNFYDWKSKEKCIPKITC